MSFANPYNFAAIDEDNIPRNKDWLKHAHEKFSEHGENGHCGKIVCNIHFRSNFITVGKNKYNEKKQLRINGNYGIQSTSLKGMLRTIAEAISNSCISLIHDNNKQYVNPNAWIDYCDNKNGLCICCRLFGTTVKKDDDEKSFTYRGKVRLSDAEYTKFDNGKNIIPGIDPRLKEKKYLEEYSLMVPRPPHRDFYFNGNKIKGRKFYYHHKNDRLSFDKINNAAKVELIKKGAIFQFTLIFENLTDEEYALLLWTLELDSELGHKIGMGKPLGLGSCVIEIEKINEFSKNRYLSIAEDDMWDVYEKEKLKGRIEDIRMWWTARIPNDLQCILKIENGFTEVRYPKKPKHGLNEFVPCGALHDPCNEFP